MYVCVYIYIYMYETPILQPEAHKYEPGSTGRSPKWQRTCLWTTHLQ